MVDDLEKLRVSLSAMPVPEPKRGFVDRVLANAAAGQAASRPGTHTAFRRHATWWAAGAGALAATIACVALFWKQPDAAPSANVVLALNESREVSLVIDSERALEGATIRLYATGSVTLAGYEHQQEIEWKTSITQGANLLSLPVFGRTAGDGSVVAEIEHDGRTRRLRVALHVSAAKDDTV
ncbi:MAG: hypothetical protein ABI769_04360 [Pseudomonadota bacterium]